MPFPGSESKSQREAVVEHLNRVLDDLGCNDETKAEAFKLTDLADRKGLLTGGSSLGLAAGIAYISCVFREQRLTLEVIGSAFGVSPSTTGKHYKRIARALGYGAR